MVVIRKHTEGDTRVATRVPTIKEFDKANESHVSDVTRLASELSKHFLANVQKHDYTKIEEPYRSLFYRELYDAIQFDMDFVESEWYKSHCNEWERHHLDKHCPDDVTLLDVLEMIIDFVAAGAARGGQFSLHIDSDILQKAVTNTETLLKNMIVVQE